LALVTVIAQKADHVPNIPSGFDFAMPRPIVRLEQSAFWTQRWQLGTFSVLALVRPS
jgi:hypothetical protein